MRRHLVISSGLAFAFALGLGLTSRLAAAEPVLDHVITAPTAWIPGAGTLVVGAGLDHRLDGSATVAYGLGGLAAIELGADTELRACAACTGGRDPGAAAEPIWRAHAAFRIGARQDAWVRGMPALALATRVTPVAGGPFHSTRVTEVDLVASRELGPVRVHVSAGVTAIGFRPEGVGARELGPTLRPAAGLEWTPGAYPRTSLLADMAWVARLDAAAPRLEWVAGWGVRYQAVRWGSIELAVRHREAEGLGASTVLVRMSGVLSTRGSRAPGQAVARSSSSSASPQ